MEKKDVDLWWDVIQHFVQKDIGKVYRKYERNERMYRLYMEKTMPLFEYKPLVLSLKPKTSNEEKNKGDTDDNIVVVIRTHSNLSTNNYIIVNRGIERATIDSIYNRKLDIASI